MIEIIKKDQGGLIVFKPQIFEDSRGFFAETYNKRELYNIGIADEFLQDNHSMSRKGVLRGMHFQKECAQAQIVRVVRGKIYDVAVNINPQSDYFGKYMGVELSAENHYEYYMSKDYAHGFLVLSDYAEVLYKCSQNYHPEFECGVRYDDADINIDWPLGAVENLIISDRDKEYKTLRELFGKGRQ